MQHYSAANACLLIDDSPTSYILIFCKSYRVSGCVLSDTYHMTHIKVILVCLHEENLGLESLYPLTLVRDLLVLLSQEQIFAFFVDDVIPLISAQEYNVFKK